MLPAGAARTLVVSFMFSDDGSNPVLCIYILVVYC